MSLARAGRREGLLSAAIALLLGSAVAAAQEHSQHHPPDHAVMDHGKPAQADEHAAHDMAPSAPRQPIPALTDADRAAAFPDIREGHAAHDSAPHTFLLFDQLEATEEDGETGLSWDVLGWAGGDERRLWLRSEGERFAGRTESADVELLYGRAFARWWDLVVGVQQDFDPGSSQTFVGIGVVGLSPYKFEIEATAYVGESGQARAALEAEYEILLTNRLVMQPLVELTFHAEDDEGRDIGAGLSTVEAGLRLRYEFTRRFAPYVGLVHERGVSRTADFRRAEGEAAGDTLVVAGVRTWF